ncbi:MAG: hypothetical protein WBX05_11930 [Pseudolabrys sp.]
MSNTSRMLSATVAAQWPDQRFRSLPTKTTKRPALPLLHLPGGHANPKGRASRQRLGSAQFRSLDRTLDDQDA